MTTDMRDSTIDEDLDRRLILMARTVVVLFRQFEQIAREMEITIPQYRFLLFLKRGPKRAGELAVEAAIRKPTASGLIADMEKRGLIQRAPDKSDGRSIHLTLTRKGLAKHREFEMALARYLPSLLEEGNADAMLDAFEELAYIIDAKRDNAPVDPGDS
ncbi:MarR family winged helix-turn-helix transcriptional regulator [Parvibaculum sp.]|uniref:MarR family winged helix-turn-helix transcriptional regulator n=1 Tax=Parvibaculum sp. TaxID=2024848 RepID=UPI00272F3BED|nr:MarR family transcriptional regulator [Parvibaculum sp.]MDP1626828.1 MarR family transcriptional regulator [Parvibaculum sp.]MDP2148474.1 MarR family transcriptional regulator [Parvibaculum sp.]MDP3327008.1 MarR family transcriptional regulator [Parvibaculum sp.]